jgi:hypothetical protein
MVAGYTLGLDKEAAEHLLVVVKGTFTLPRPGELSTLAPEQVPLVDADLFTGEPGRSSTLVECDYALEKPYCDLLLNGTAYAPGGRAVQRMMVGLQLGNWRKSFAVYGDRVWRSAGISYFPSQPAPFERMPISYDNAFGGTDDRFRDPSRHRSYLPNPVGRGWHYHMYRELVVDSPLPNTEEANDPVRDPRGNYRPMAFGAIGRGWPSRIKFAGTYDEDWLQNTFPFLPADFDKRYYQVAPRDQQIPIPTGPLDVVLINLTPDGQRHFDVPFFDAPIHIFPRRGSHEKHIAHMDTIIIEPDHERFTITWRLCRRLERDLFDIAQVQVGGKGREGWIPRAEAQSSVSMTLPAAT